MTVWLSEQENTICNVATAFGFSLARVLRLYQESRNFKQIMAYENCGHLHLIQEWGCQWLTRVITIWWSAIVRQITLQFKMLLNLLVNSLYRIHWISWAFIFIDQQEHYYWQCDIGIWTSTGPENIIVGQ